MANEIIPVPKQNGTSAGTEIAMTRAAQEIQAAMLVAKRFPRDETASIARIVNACKRKALADVSQYEYPRGGTKVTGPSIRLAEVLAQSWGNIEAGVVELDRKEGHSTAMAYCWDLETNSRDVKVFEVRHVRDRKESKGGALELTEERDIYELVANMGARRKRACILAIIPPDVQEMALIECDKTMAGSGTGPLIDRVRKMVIGFERFTVTQGMIEQRLGHKVEACSEIELVALGKIYNSMRDGMSAREQHFDTGQQPTEAGKSKTDALADELTAKMDQSPKKPAEDHTQETGHGVLGTGDILGDQPNHSFTAAGVSFPTAEPPKSQAAPDEYQDPNDYENFMGRGKAGNPTAPKTEAAQSPEKPKAARTPSSASDSRGSATPEWKSCGMGATWLRFGGPALEAVAEKYILREVKHMTGDEVVMFAKKIAELEASGELKPVKPAVAST